MDLKDFIKTAIANITGAIADSQAELRNGAVIAPVATYGGEVPTITIDGRRRLVSTIDFDIAVTASSSDGSSGKGGLDIKVFSAALSSESSHARQDVSRITFAVPVMYPVPVSKTDAEAKSDAAALALAAMRERLRPHDSNTNPSTQIQ